MSEGRSIFTKDALDAQDIKLFTCHHGLLSTEVGVCPRNEHATCHHIKLGALRAYMTAFRSQHR